MTIPLNAIKATVNYANAADPVLQFKFSDLKNVLSWTTTPTAANENAEPWIASLLQLLADYTTNQGNNQSANLTVSQPIIGTQTRNQIANRPTRSYTSAVFLQTPIAVIYDADDLA